MPRPLPFAVAILVALTLAPPARGAPASTRPTSWTWPVRGTLARAFHYYEHDPFKAGWHRGVDIAARVGGAVRAACSGRVVTASGSPGGGVVTLGCAQWRVTELPLATIAVRAGATVRAGARLGTLGRNSEHDGLHLGVRRASQRFGYVDPLLFMPSREPSPPPAVPAPAPPGGARGVPAPPPPMPRLRVRVHVVRPPGGPASWPAWLGGALVVLGAVGGGARIRVRRRRAALAPHAGEAVA